MSMSARYLVLVGVSLFPIVINGQDSGATSSAGLATAYGTQGNVALNRTLHERELMAAAQEARELKALKAAMAAQAQANYANPQTYMTAQQFLAANRPPAPPPSETEPVVRRDSYLPEFQTGGVNTTAEPPSNPEPVPTYTNPVMPEKKRTGLFDLFKSKKETSPEYTENPYEGPDVPPATYVDPETEAPVVDNLATQEEAMFEATVSPEEATFELPSREKPNLLDRLFSRSHESESADRPPAPAPVPQSMPEAPVEEELPPAPPVVSNDIPEVPGVDEDVAPPPTMAPPAPEPQPEEPSPIFVKRNTGGGSSATLKADAKAKVAGVNVTLFAGTKVTVLERSGSDATIRLPDGRVGTISSSNLSF